MTASSLVQNPEPAAVIVEPSRFDRNVKPGIRESAGMFATGVTIVAQNKFAHAPGSGLGPGEPKMGIDMMDDCHWICHQIVIVHVEKLTAKLWMDVAKLD